MNILACSAYNHSNLRDTIKNFHAGYISNYNTVSSDLDRRNQICSFCGGRVGKSRYLNTNTSLTLHVNQDSKSDVRDKFHEFYKRIFCLD